MGSVIFQKKLTMATVGLQTRGLEEVSKGQRDVSVARVIGFITGMESKSSDLGPYIAFKGEFEATNLLTEQVYRSGAMILPGVAEIPLVSEVASAAPGSRVKFALDVTVTENISSKGGTKFKYGVRSLMEPSKDDDLTKLAKALPAPASGKKSK